MSAGSSDYGTGLSLGQTLKQGLGYGLEGLAFLDSLRRPGGIGQFMQQRAEISQDPAARAGLMGSPLLSAFFGMGGQQAPTVPPGMAANVFQQAGIQPGQFIPDLPPLNPEAQVQNAVQRKVAQGLPNLPPQAVAAGLLGIHPPVDPAALEAAGFQPYSINSQGGMTFHRGPAGLPALPRGTLPADIQRSPVTGYGQSPSFPNVLFPLKEPKAAGGAKEPTNEFQLWRRDHPTGTFEQFQAAKAEGAAGRQTAVEAAKATALTNATKTMKEAAPKVIHFVDRIEKELGTIETGPAASRYQEFMAGHIGAPNPEFTKYRTNVGLLTTLLLRMHVGARGGQQMLDHFSGLLSAGTQSAANMHAALGEIRAYADDVAGVKATDTEGAPIAEGTTPGGLKYRILQSPTQ